MPRQLHVHLLPALFEPSDVSGGIAIVVDILRASTTIVHALANGAAGVIPCGTVKEAFAHRENSSQPYLFGGERGGVKIDGFDLSNSPDDYSSAVVENKTICFTTTNGTKALLRSEQADKILIGAFVNFSAIVDHLQNSRRPIHMVCAGTNGVITGEDTLFAGAVTHAILERTADLQLNDAATLAVSHWRQECDDLSPQKIEQSLRRAQGGRNLIELGYDKDITTAAAVDSVPVIGRVDDSRIIRRSGTVS